MADGGCDGLLDDGEVVEAFFDEEPDDAVGVEDKVCAGGALVADHTFEGEKALRLAGVRYFTLSNNLPGGLA